MGGINRPELTSESQRLPPPSNRRSYQPPPNMPGAFLQRRNGPDPPTAFIPPPPPNQMFASYDRGQGPSPTAINPMFNRPFVPGQPMPGPQMFGAFDGRTQRSPGGDGFDLLDGNNVFLLGAIAICMFFLNRQMNDDFKKRRKRQVSSVFENQYQKANLETGLEDFEGKIEKIAGGVDKDENSWLNKLYKQYHGESLAETLEGDTLAEENEDEMALSNDEHESVENRAFRKKRSDEEVVRKEEEDIEAIFNSVESSCSTKFWRCVSNVIEGGLHYTEMPGGLTGAMKKHLMKVVFAGGISNMWDSLMTVPEARKFQKCMAKQTECTEYEILQKALNSEKALPQRVLVVPETVKVEEEPEK